MTTGVEDITPETVCDAFELCGKHIGLLACGATAENFRVLEEQLLQGVPDGAGIAMRFARGQLVAFDAVYVGFRCERDQSFPQPGTRGQLR